MHFHIFGRKRSREVALIHFLIYEQPKGQICRVEKSFNALGSSFT